ncbi:MAG: hypothetical protein NTW73_00455 [Candidatus Parcubacteria bacterium]|nr:hypothetical protein [Candidatus Parcubacteria bacterium]
MNDFTGRGAEGLILNESVMSHFKNGRIFKRFVLPDALGPITVSILERRFLEGAVK